MSGNNVTETNSTQDQRFAQPEADVVRRHRCDAMLATAIGAMRRC